MARKSNIARDKKRHALHAKHQQKRALMKEASDADGLAKLPANSSPTRLKNRCSLCGRPRSYMREFGLCRLCFREQAVNGNIPGVTKASW